MPDNSAPTDNLASHVAARRNHCDLYSERRPAAQALRAAE
ncbi:hypothetical protein PLANPX_3198 [Lacipirellula parvula]|uniref:Uncharacterized protein n=1 Tax=Lacipirellula parvula TaxID=2650471 RepID=A0A5K7XH19_9BACT|nr:hypothetical protein PLANPX_3198 [Lacipirellula parvula]